MSEKSMCPVCHSTFHSERSYKNDRYLQCLQCNLIWRDPPVDLSQVTEYYETDNPTESINESKRSLYKNVLQNAEIKLGKKGRLLDVGCGNGDFLYLAKEIGWTVKGIEPVKQLVDQARSRGLDVVTGVLKDLPHNDSYDLITYWDVFMMIEHPEKEKEEIKKRLANGGVLFKRIRQHKVVRMMEEFWRYLFKHFGVSNPAVYHPYNYEPKTITHLWKNNGYILTIQNGMLTSGDPYSISNKKDLVYIAKRIIQGIISVIEKIPVEGPYLSPTMDIWIKKAGENDVG